MTKKELAISFLKMVANRDIRRAYELYIAPEFIHHNQFFKGDRQSLLLAMEEAARVNPHKVLTVKQAFEDGATVITHSHVKQNPEDTGAAVVHIFRFKNDRVVELWDLGQPLMKDSPNENGMF
jgi:predicted SnoaL-like aldol condensation-catalyzing enzyme